MMGFLHRSLSVLLLAIPFALQASAQPGEMITGAKILRDLAFGPNGAQTMDVYLPPHPRNAPVILMVHGGAWMVGDKSMGRVVTNKAAYWLPKGYIFISINNRCFRERSGVLGRNLSHPSPQSRSQADAAGVLDPPVRQSLSSSAAIRCESRIAGRQSDCPSGEYDARPDQRRSRTARKLYRSRGNLPAFAQPAIVTQIAEAR
jgi:hypothetical protein